MIQFRTVCDSRNFKFCVTFLYHFYFVDVADASASVCVVFLFFYSSCWFRTNWRAREDVVAVGSMAYAASLSPLVQLGCWDRAC